MIASYFPILVSLSQFENRYSVVSQFLECKFSEGMAADEGILLGTVNICPTRWMSRLLGRLCVQVTVCSCFVALNKREYPDSLSGVVGGSFCGSRGGQRLSFSTYCARSRVHCWIYTFLKGCRQNTASLSPLIFRQRNRMAVHGETQLDDRWFPCHNNKDIIEPGASWEVGWHLKIFFVS